LLGLKYRSHPDAARQAPAPLKPSEFLCGAARLCPRVRCPRYCRAQAWRAWRVTFCCMPHPPACARARGKLTPGDWLQAMLHRWIEGALQRGQRAGALAADRAA